MAAPFGQRPGTCLTPARNLCTADVMYLVRVMSTVRDGYCDICTNVWVWFSLCVYLYSSCCWAAASGSVIYFTFDISVANWDLFDATLHARLTTTWFTVLTSATFQLKQFHFWHTGWRKKTGPPYVIANILKILWPNCVEICELLQYYMLNIVINFLFKNFITLWRHLAKTSYCAMLKFISTMWINDSSCLATAWWNF